MLKGGITDFKIDLKEEAIAFKRERNLEALLHLAIRSELSREHLANHKTKTRAEVSGTGKKPWQQKKTGRARAGSRRSPIFTGGGVVFGPNPNRNYLVSINKRQYLQAARYLLNLFRSEGRIFDFGKLLNSFKTKVLLERLEELGIRGLKCLIISEDSNTLIAARNLAFVEVTSVNRLRLYDIYKSRVVLIDSASLEKLNQRFGLAAELRLIAKKRKISITSSLESGDYLKTTNQGVR